MRDTRERANGPVVKDLADLHDQARRTNQLKRYEYSLFSICQS